MARRRSTENMRRKDPATFAKVLQRLTDIEKRQRAIEDDWKQLRNEYGAMRAVVSAASRKDWGEVQKLIAPIERMLSEELGSEKRKVRRFSNTFKARVLYEYEQAPYGTKAAVLRYYKISGAQITGWRKAIKEGRLEQYSSKPPAEIAGSYTRRELLAKARAETAKMRPRKTKWDEPVAEPAVEHAAREEPPQRSLGTLKIAEDLGARFALISGDDDDVE